MCGTLGVDGHRAALLAAVLVARKVIDRDHVASLGLAAERLERRYHARQALARSIVLSRLGARGTDVPKLATQA